MSRSDHKFVVSLTIPAILFFFAFFLYPVVLLIYYSFFDVNLLALQDKTYIGTQNYVDALTSKSTLILFKQTIQYTLITLFSELILGFLAALAFNALGEKSKVLRTVFLFPLMVAPVVAGLLWKFFLASDFGLLNYILKGLGLIKSVDQIAWLSDPKIVIYSVALPDIWLTTCFVMMVVYTGLQNIPVELTEAAKIDGANTIKTFWYITLPLLRPVIAAVVILRGIDAARTFDAIYLMTGGGPMKKSEVLSLRIYQTMIKHGHLGSASALATLFLIFMLVICLIAYFTIWKPKTAKSK